MFTIGWKRPYDRFDGSKILLLTSLIRIDDERFRKTCAEPNLFELCRGEKTTLIKQQEMSAATAWLNTDKSIRHNLLLLSSASSIQRITTPPLAPMQGLADGTTRDYPTLPKKVYFSSVTPHLPCISFSHKDLGVTDGWGMIFCRKMSVDNQPFILPFFSPSLTPSLTF